jgi:tripartite-type tricarboxylate transporter receptor subunit TctC
MMRRRGLLRSAVAMALPAAGLPALAQDYPAKAITLVVAFAAGGAGDLVARRIGQKLSENTGQAVVVENRPGAGAAVAAVTVAKSRPDGYTLLLTGNGTSISAALFRSLPYSLARDFRHVSTLAFFDLAMIVGGASEFGSVADVLAYAKANPGRLSIGTARVGSTQHLAAELFKSMAGIDAVCVPYRSTAEMLTALRVKDLPVAFEIVPPILGQINAKAVRVLAVAAARRFPGLPDVPTLAESGVPGYEATSWAGISVPARTPTPVVRRLAQEFERAVAAPEVQESLQSLGFVARASTPEQMTERIEQDMAKWSAVIDKAGIPRQ